MKSAILGIGSAALLVGCASQLPQIPRLLSPTPTTPQAALEDYYETIPDSKLPAPAPGKSLPGQDEVLDLVLVGSCLNEELGKSEALMSMASSGADLALLLGDNVYGDMDGRRYVNNNADLPELRESFADLGGREDFSAFLQAVPVMVAWDDHDYGSNDTGGEFAFKGLAERIHEQFWGLSDEDVGQWPGTYYARSFGPEGQRVQVIMLDTRFFRSQLTHTDQWGAPGKERYLPAPEGTMQDMLGAAQWTWLENQLQQPADIRIIASSIQVLPTVHGWEAWDKLPAERERLFELVQRTGATGVVLASGDRHTAFLYEEEGVLPYRAVELTASSLNMSFSDSSDEMDSRQIGPAYAPENFGAIRIDWASRQVVLEIRDAAGAVVQANTVDFAELGVN